LKVSIITTVFNKKETIKYAIESVLNQTYSPIEYIIIDGASTDGTVEIVKTYGSAVTMFTSESDEGIYDGLNKGINAATGDIVAFVHGDDLYESNEVVAKVVEAFKSGGVDGVYGDLTYTNKNDSDKILRYWKSKDFDCSLLKKGWMPAHPTLFLKREVYEKFGQFDLNFKIAADYDFMLRVLIGGIKVKYLPEVLYKMRAGGESNKSLRNILLKYKEDIRALRKNRVGGFYVLLIKNLSKITQFLNR
tara:strand:+ start:884 stop:1627 length:744 start_codon:yes stop_codon:yes gene_type:complete